MKAKILVLVALVATLGANAFAGPKHHFIMNNSRQPGYASYPGQTFYLPSYYGKLFLANTSDELQYASYPRYSSYPGYSSCASYSNPREAFAERAHKVCQFMSFGSARYASSHTIEASWQQPAELLSIDYGNYGNLYVIPGEHAPIYQTMPTVIDTLECVR